jgi:hypothetical protein
MNQAVTLAPTALYRFTFPFVLWFGVWAGLAAAALLLLRCAAVLTC